MRTVRKIVAAVAFLAIAAIAVAFAVANRDAVEVSLWPLPYAVTLRLSAALLGALAIGIVLGGAIAWASGTSRRMRRRSKARQAESQRSPPFGPTQPAAAPTSTAVTTVAAAPPGDAPKRLTAAVDRD